MALRGMEGVAAWMPSLPVSRVHELIFETHGQCRLKSSPLETDVVIRIIFTLDPVAVCRCVRASPSLRVSVRAVLSLPQILCARFAVPNLPLR